jgi:uncharacterized protein (DUF302 family)
MTSPRYSTKQSRHTFADTVELLTTAIRQAGNTVFATIDQAAAAKQVGLDLRPTVLVIFGNPRGGTPLMSQFPAIALQLPLKLVISETPDGVLVLHDRVAALAPDYGVSADHPAVAAMDRALEMLTGAVAETAAR